MGPIELLDGHESCVLCLGRAHVETVMDGSGCPHCEEMSVRALSFCITIAHGDAMPTNMLHPSAAVELWRKKQTIRRPLTRETSSHRANSHALCSPEPVTYAKDSLHPSEGACGLVSFGVSEDDDDAMSTTTLEREDWSRSPVPESTAPHSEASEHVAAAGDVELDEWFLHSGCRQSFTPHKHMAFFLKVHNEIAQSWRTPHSAQAHANGSTLLATVDGADLWS